MTKRKTPTKELTEVVQAEATVEEQPAKVTHVGDDQAIFQIGVLPPDTPLAEEEVLVKPKRKPTKPKQKPTKVAQAKMATKALTEAEEVTAPRSCVNCGQDWLEIQAKKKADGNVYFYCQLCEHEYDVAEMESPFWRNLGRK